MSVCGLFLIALAAVLAAADAHAQYRIDSWTVEQGLPQNIVRALHQTSDGYLWLATLDGLVRFDGLQFVVYDRASTPGIGSNRFTPLYEDRAGDLWIGTENGGVTRRHRGAFTTYTTRDGLPSNVVDGITGDESGRLWVLSGDRVTTWDGRRFHAADSGSLALPFYNSEWTAEIFWAVEPTKLHRFTKGRITSWVLPPEVRGASTGRVEQDPSGAIWMGLTHGRHARLIPGETLTLDRIFDPRQQPQGGSFSPDSHFDYIDRHGRRWSIAVDDDLKRHLDQSTGPSHTHLPFAAMRDDDEGSLWLGTDGQGLLRLRVQAVRTYSRAEGLADRNVYAIAEDRDGAVWMGTWSRGLSRYKDGAFSTYTVADGLPNALVMALAADRDGRLWISTRDPRNGGLCLLTQGRLRPAPEIVPFSALVAAIHQDRDGAMWFGTTAGLIRYQDGKTTTFTSKDGLAGDDIRVIVDGGPGRLWIGAYGGLTLYDRGSFRRWTEHEGLPSDSVRALYVDPEGVLWIGTYDGGLGRFQNGRFTVVTTKQGLYNNGVFQILEDQHGDLWMTSNRGIHRVAKRELNALAAGQLRAVNASSFGRSDGLRNAECNGGVWPAGVRARDGRLWFPTQDGVAVIDPNTMTRNPHAPTVVIESAEIEGAAQPIATGLRLAPGQERIEIRYTGIALLNAERLAFRYRLIGLDDDWVNAGTRRTVQYTHLPPGGYRFEVQAANSDGVWSPTGAALDLTVVPPFWRTWWFQWVLGLTLVTSATAAYHRRVATLRRAAAERQAFARQLIGSQEQERRRVAAELHDSLGQHLLVIKNRAVIGEGLTAPASPVRVQFDEIIESAATAIDEVRRIAYGLRPVSLEQLGLTAVLEEMSARVSSASGLPIDADIAALDDRVAPEAAIIMYRIVQEALNNVVRHAQATRAGIEAWPDADGVHIIIRDNGRGFSTGQALRPATGRRGLGLNSIVERVTMLHGTHDIDSEPGKGTTITIRLPLSALHAGGISAE